ncbi:MAG: cation:proton antiporter [Thermoguttaceae bacterium]
MDTPLVARLVLDLLVILLAGLSAGVISKRFGLSVLVGYLTVGAVLGSGGLGVIRSEMPQVKSLAQAGALLLLFSIGLEFSLGELVRLGRALFLGGTLQMLLVAAPATLLAVALGLGWRPGILAGTAAALSSTILVYKALEEFGQTETPHGRRAIAILLFQDAALVPLMLLVPLLCGAGEGPSTREWLSLGGVSVFFVAAVLGLRYAVSRAVIPMLAGLRSTELVVLFALTVLGGAGLAAYAVGLPPALGALAAGLVLSQNRLTAQIDALFLPYRETFAAIFFVSLGTLMRLDVLVEHPGLCLGGLLVVLALKTAAAAAALRAVGLPWRPAVGMAMGMAQLGEFSFLLLSAGLAVGILEQEAFHVLLTIAVGTLILTPLLIRTGLRWTDPLLGDRADTPQGPGGEPPPGYPPQAGGRAVVIGLGPIGAQVASRLETSGIDVCLVDLSPVNLHPFAQEGFHTVAGDATDTDVLRRAGLRQCGLAVVTVPKDQAARQIVAAIRRLNRTCRVLVRCRYRGNVAGLRQAGADAVVSEEEEASAGLLRLFPLLPLA